MWKLCTFLATVLLLVVIPLVRGHSSRDKHNEKSNSKRPECYPCTANAQCESGYCYGTTCIKHGDKVSHARCLRPECASCRLDSECSTRRCFRRRCIRWTSSSFYKCFISTPRPSPSPRPTAPVPLQSPRALCARCTHHAQCSEGFVCAGSPRVCHDNTPRSRKACFRPECAMCIRSTQCASSRCEGGRCVYNTAASRARCLPGRKPECARCSTDDECVTSRCAGRPVKKCVDGTKGSRRRCFGRPECAHCRGFHDCALGRCMGRKCTDGSYSSLLRCGVLPSNSPTASPLASTSPSASSVPSASPTPMPIKAKECGPCRKSEECEADLRCFRRVCSEGSRRALERCGFRPLCARCSRNWDCATRRCRHSVCTDDDYQGLVRCGLRRECDACDTSADCATGWCKNYSCTFPRSSGRTRKC